MKKEYYLKGLLVLVVMFLQFVKTEEINAQSIQFKNVTDTTKSYSNPAISKLGGNFVVVSRESEKGFGGPSLLSINLFNNKLQNLIDTTLVNFPVSSTDISVASDQTGVYVAHSLNADVSLLKIDSAGNVLWSSLPFSSAGFDNPTSLKISGNSLLLSGQTDGTGNNDAFFSKLDLNGNVIWVKCFEGFAATSFEVTSAGNYFVLVKSFDSSFVVVNKVYYLDSSGNEIWNSTLTNGFTATTTVLDKESGLLVVALKEEAATSKIAFLTVDELSNISSVHLTTQKGSVVQMKDSYAGFVVAGNYEGVTSGAYPAEYDISFNRLWENKRPKGASLSKSFTGVTEGNCSFIFVGNQERLYGGIGSTYDLVLLKATYNNFPDVSISLSGSTVICPGQTLTISVPFDPNTTYVWKKYGNILAGETSNSITVNSAGKYKVIATSQYGCSKTSAVVDVTIGTVCRIASFDEPETEKTFKFYPNPATDQITIESELELGEIQVFNSIGSLVLQKTLDSTEEILNISELKPGVYFVKMGQKTLRLVKK